MRYAHVQCIVHFGICFFFFGGGGGYTSIHRKIITVIPYRFILNAIKAHKYYIDFKVANDVLPI